MCFINLISLLLTIACSTSIALILKYSSVNKGNPILLISGNYFIASVIGIILFFVEPNAGHSLSTLLFGAVIGGIFVFSFFSFAKSIDVAGTALSTLSSRISLFIPVILSIIFFNEEPELIHVFGFALAGLTIYLFSQSLKRDKSRTITSKDSAFLLVLMIGIGIGDFTMKIFQHTQPIAEKQFFIFSIFFFSFIYSFGFVLLKKIPFDKRTILSGGILGVPNILSSIFLIAALESIEAILVYPLVNIGIILFTAIFAYLIWHESLNRLGIISLITGLASIILLTL